MTGTSLRLSAGLLAGLWVVHALAAPPPSASSTAWHDGRFHIDVPGVLHRSDIFPSGMASLVCPPMRRPAGESNIQVRDSSMRNGMR